MQDAMTSPPEKLLRVEGNGILYLSVGYANTDQGVGWFDQAVLFCPFCGTALQSHAEILRRAGA
jgi:hypothetical protein